MERLQKLIAEAGLASRRQAEEWIRQGRVSVNGRTVTELGEKADPERDYVKVDGRLIRPPERKVYILLNKPRQVISAAADPEGRVKVTDLVGAGGRVFPVGRLDYNTEGLILLTNDGEFSRIVASAGGPLAKVYHAKVRGTPSPEAIDRLRRGVRIPGGVRLAPCRIVPLKPGANSWYEVTLTEGRNRQIRDMFDFVGHPVVKLRRVRIGFLTDRGLEPGQHRRLTPEEVERVFAAARGRRGEGAGGGSWNRRGGSDNL